MKKSIAKFMVIIIIYSLLFNLNDDSYSVDAKAKVQDSQDDDKQSFDDGNYESLNDTLLNEKKYY